MFRVDGKAVMTHENEKRNAFTFGLFPNDKTTGIAVVTVTFKLNFA